MERDEDRGESIVPSQGNCIQVKVLSQSCHFVVTKPRKLGDFSTEWRVQRGEVRGEVSGNDVGTRRALSAGGRGLVISVFARFPDNARVVPTNSTTHHPQSSILIIIPSLRGFSIPIGATCESIVPSQGNCIQVKVLSQSCHFVVTKPRKLGDFSTEWRVQRGEVSGNDVGTRRALSAGGRGLVIGVFAWFPDNARVVPTIPSFAILRARSNRHRI